ncbi:protein kinase domain-containing protein [Nannocystaceae bacterium ST9]
MAESPEADYHRGSQSTDMEVNLDGYRAQRMLRSSGTSEVWEVIRVADQRLVIAKVFAIEDRSRLDDAAARQSNQARVDHEFDMIRRLEVPGVVRALALERTGDQLVLLLEAHRGIDLGEFVRRSPLAVSTFLDVAIQIARILADVHEQRVVHRDIKPTNILIDPDTGEVVLADFGISELLASERGHIHDRAVIEGTLPYMAPEQTGRTAREVDFRSDLYSLGVTFYEALTGQRPFTGQSPLELIHAHLARKPTPPQRLRPELPTLLSDLVMKLLEKAPERRYQSARGLWRDLCAMQAQQRSPSATIDELVLGRDDVPLTLRLPHQIHGRERERASLQAAFLRAIAGRPQLVVIAGAAGVGKTMLIDDLVEPVLGHRGFMARGRFAADSDQPLSGIVAALSTLADQLLTAPSDQLELWRKLLLARLGSLAAVIGELAPSFRLVFGEQQATDDSRTAIEIRNQVMLACVRLLTSVARPDHPLVLALDEVEHADKATLDLLDALLAESQPGLLIVLAARDHALAPGSELATLLIELHARELEPTLIDLGPLGREPLIQLIADMLSRPPEAVTSLAEIVARKTDSNPFFVGQLLLHLAELGLLRRESEGWVWDPEALEAAALPDDVLDMMTRKLAELGDEPRRLLQAASVIGSPFEAATLVRTTAIDEVDARLFALVDEGLIAPLGTGYVFGHERIREAAYASLDPGERARMHLQIGRELAGSLDKQALDQRVFDLVEHLDRGYQLGDPETGDPSRLEPAQLVELAELNVRAGQRSITSGAPKSAEVYLAVAGRVLAALGEFPGRGRPHHALYVAVEFATAQVEVLDKRFDAADQRLAKLLARELEFAEVGAAADLRTWALSVAARHDVALRSAIAVLRSLGVAVPVWPENRHLPLALIQLLRLARPATLERLRTLPPVEDPRMSAAMDVLLRLSNVTYMVSPAAFIVMIVAHAQLLLRYGTHDSAPLVVAQIALVVADAFDRQRQALEIGRLARDLAERSSERMLVQVRQAGNFLRMWSKPFAELHADLADIFDRAIEQGNRDVAESLWVMRTMVGLYGGQHLRLVEAQAENRVRWSESWNGESALAVGETCRRLIVGPPPGEDDHDPLGVLAGLSTSDDKLGMLANQRICTAIVFATFGRWAEVHLLLHDLCDRIERGMGRIWFITIARVLLGVSAAVLARESRGPEHKRLLATLRRSLRRFARWNANGAGHQFHEALLRAELASCAGEVGPAIEHFELARERAALLRNPFYEALASERLAAMMLERGRERLATGALIDARDRYQHWGAFAKVAALEQRWPELARRSLAARSGAAGTSTASGSIGTTTGSTSSSTTSKAIDSATLLEASQMLTEDIRLEDVVVRVMAIALENAGAQRGVLLLADHDKLALAAESTAEGETRTLLAQPTPLDEAQSQVATTIIRWVERTGEPVVLADAASDPRFQSDLYLRTSESVSVLCLPFVKRGRLIGLLYLENRLSAGSFLPERLELLRVLTAQTASALENARLYDELRTSESRWRSLVEQLPDYVVLVNRDGGLEYVNLGARSRATPTSHFDPSALSQGDDPHRVSAALGRVFEHGTREQFELQARIPSGELRWYSVRIAPIVVDATIERAIVVATDISDRKAAEVQREQLESQLRQQQRLESIGTLASGVAHEINNPVQGIMNYAELIAGSSEASDEIREFAGEIEFETQRVTTIVRNLLAFSRQELDESNQPIAVADIVDGTLSLIRTVLRRDQIALELDVPRELPPVACRRQQIQQVIMNLVTNARDALNNRWPGYHEDKRIEIRASRFEREGKPWLRLSVDDRGGGIEAAVVARIFDPFFTTKGRDQGTGLGLAVSHGIIAEHGGKLVLDNRFGEGACFSIELPISL